MAAAIPDYEQAGELKIGQVGIANLRVRTLDVPRLTREMRERVQRAPKLFARAAVIVDFGGLPTLPGVAEARALIDGLGEAGVLPVALAYGSSESEALAEALGLPVLAKFRAQYESAAPVAPEPAPPPPPPAPAPAAEPAGAPMLLSAPIRSGQQIYARGGDLTVCATVGAGAEVIADGSVHVYGALRGRALAGASNDPRARIFCREFHAELVAVAGHYRVLEEIPAALHGKAVQVWLENDTLRIEELT
ncbi:septum site-determining protein MinC [Coralloluteibacterium stylophorae]|uniref:Probable septum site-determining protein MinC n=1 Tax=Coralloluteibacterium stylophorae TaxID=1776034 RepID=A0A8J7VQP8_9GAMM|nr:septum site-determining protein MinC [Coralloluteibacterium stylophorae]MBS7456416.1 septum site-determining protein MinC [Coralloluteibacterium stylophorae]